MLLPCLTRETARDPRLALADFLRTPLARLRYGRATIYPGETYYIPCYTIELTSPREGTPVLFLGSAVTDDVAVCLNDGRLRQSELDCEESRVLEVRKTPLEVRREIEKKIKMNRRLRKAYGPCRVDETAMTLTYIPEPSFFVQARKYRLFLVDPLTEKVDLRHLPMVEELFLAAEAKATPPRTTAK